MDCPKCGGTIETQLLWSLSKRTYTCANCGYVLPENVPWIVTVSVDDVNYRTRLPQLTDEELEICLKMEQRKTSLQRLRGEKRRRQRKCSHST